VAISDMVEKRSAIYSDRSIMPMMELMDLTNWVIPLLPYGDKWRSYRKLFHEMLHSPVAEDFDNHRYKHVHNFLWRLLNSPENFMDDAAFMAGALIMSITYGLDIQSADDPDLKATVDGWDGLRAAVMPGSFLVDAFPLLRYVPSWFPGGGFQTIAKRARKNMADSISGSMSRAKEIVKSGEGHRQSMVSSCLSRLDYLEQEGYNETSIRDVAGGMFLGSTDTVTTSLLAFFLAMVFNPHVMKKAQEELDHVVGHERLPEFSDMEHLPYLNALVKEVLRWNPPAPLGMAKRLIQDDTYNGYFIPAGTMVIENIWAVFHDPQVFPEPEKFDPERYLKDGKIDPSAPEPDYRAFGAGRRICPGRHFALRTLCLNIACILSVFDIGASLGEDGKPQFPPGDFEETATRRPLPFNCTITPRSGEAIELIKSVCAPTD